MAVYLFHLVFKEYKLVFVVVYVELLTFLLIGRIIIEIIIILIRYFTVVNY